MNAAPRSSFICPPGVVLVTLSPACALFRDAFPAAPATLSASLASDVRVRTLAYRLTRLEEMPTGPAKASALAMLRSELTQLQNVLAIESRKTPRIQ